MRLRTSRLTWQELDGEAVVLDLGSSTYFSLNRSATLLLSLLRTDRSESELVSTLAREYQTDADSDLIGDVSRFLDALRSRNLLVE